MRILKLLLALLFTAGVFYGLHFKHGELPPLGTFLSPETGFWQNEDTYPEESELILPGLQEPVKLFYDEQFIPHIFAQNDHDLYYTQGYVTAKHRLWQMEFQTFAAAGRLSEIVGEKALEYDRQQRRKGLGFGAEQALKTMEDSPEVMAVLKAYRDGVNSHISTLSVADYPVEYKLLGYQPEEWTLEKTALLLMYMADMLAGRDYDLEFTNLINTLGREQFELLFPDFYDSIDPVIPPQKEWSEWEVNIPETPENAMPSAFKGEPMDKPDPDNGSNNWAIAPSKSKTGNAILANDPHLGLNLPSIWFVLQLATPEKNTFGASLPGAAGIISGFNEHIAWGVTNATRDVKDWYKIEFKDDAKEQYRFEDSWRDATQRIELIKVRNGETFFDTVTYTHHGPVSYDESFKGVDGKAGYAMRWTGHLGGNTQATFLDLNKARNYEDYKEALKNFVAPAQNFAFASVDGDIALWIQGKFPKKWEGQGKFLLDGSKAANDWQGFIPQEHNAHVKNPARGFISSANQHPVDESYPYYVFNDGYETYRNRVINDYFRKSDSIGIEDFKALHNNNLSQKAADLLPTLLSKIPRENLNDAEKRVLNLLEEWNFYSDAEKKAPAYWASWYEHLQKITWEELTEDSLAMRAPFSYRTIELYKQNPEHPLMDIDSTEKVETAADLFLISFKQAIQEIKDWKKKNGSLNWAKYKGTYVGHLLQALPAFSRFDLPIGGNRGIVNATGKNHGPSWRMIVEMSKPPQAWAVYPGGQSGNPGSRYYDNFIDTWAKGEYFEVNFPLSADSVNNMMISQTLKPQP